MATKDAAKSELAQAIALKAQGRLEDAAAHYLEAFNLEPDLLEAARELAFVWTELNDADQAEYFTRRALELEPGSAPMQLHLGNLLRGQGRLDEALEACLAAIELQPGFAQAHNNLGNAYLDLNRGEEAAASFRNALDLAPDLAEARLSYGILLYRRGAVREAMSHYRAALHSRPRLAPASLNLGFAHEQLGEMREAKECYARAIEADPECAEAHLNHGLQSLLAGDLAAGWKSYEWRWKLPPWHGQQPLPELPRWEGASLEGKTILLYAEQGFGDAIQFIRYAPLVAQRGARVIVRCRPPLTELLQSAVGVTGVIAEGDDIPPCDVSCALLSLPHMLGAATAIPADVPYLFANPDLSARFGERLAAAAGALKVGLVWASHSAKPELAAKKSIPLEAMEPLVAVRGVRFFSLQKGPSAREAATSRLALLDLSDELGTFADTAALIAGLDLVISTDTAVAHLAGALARPVWTVVPFPPDWRWGLHGESCAWYPTMRLFRQEQPNRWARVIEQIADALSRLPGG